jgi:hypothetical protein
MSEIYTLIDCSTIKSAASIFLVIGRSNGVVENWSNGKIQKNDKIDTIPLLPSPPILHYSNTPLVH